MADFHFHAEPMSVDFEYETFVTDANGNKNVKNNELVRETYKLFFD